MVDIIVASIPAFNLLIFLSLTIKGSGEPFISLRIPGGGYFTSIVHDHSEIVNNVSPAAGWVESSVSASAGSAIATALVNGTVTYNGIDFAVHGSNSWNFNQVFP